MFLPSAQELTNEDWELVELAQSTINANTDAGPDQDGVHTMVPQYALRTVACSLA